MACRQRSLARGRAAPTLRNGKMGTPGAYAPDRPRSTMSTSTAWGRIAEDGTVYVRTADEGERVVGSWQAGTPEEGLAHFVRRYDDLATEVGLLETRLASGAASASSTVVAVTKLRASLPTANAVGDLPTL